MWFPPYQWQINELNLVNDIWESWFFLRQVIASSHKVLIFEAKFILTKSFVNHCKFITTTSQNFNKIPTFFFLFPVTFLISIFCNRHEDIQPGLQIIFHVSYWDLQKTDPSWDQDCGSHASSFKPHLGSAFWVPQFKTHLLTTSHHKIKDYNPPCLPQPQYSIFHTHVRPTWYRSSGNQKPRTWLSTSHTEFKSQPRKHLNFNTILKRSTHEDNKNKSTNNKIESFKVTKSFRRGRAAPSNAAGSGDRGGAATGGGYFFSASFLYYACFNRGRILFCYGWMERLLGQVSNFWRSLSQSCSIYHRPRIINGAHFLKISYKRMPYSSSNGQICVSED